MYSIQKIYKNVLITYYNVLKTILNNIPNK